MNLLRVFLAPIIAVGMVSTAPASDFHDLIEFVSTSSVVQPQILTLGEAFKQNESHQERH